MTRAPIRDGHFTRSVVVAVGVGAHYKTPTTSPPIPVPVFVFIRGQRGKLGISLVEEYSIFFFYLLSTFCSSLAIGSAGSVPLQIRSQETCVSKCITFFFSILLFCAHTSGMNAALEAPFNKCLALNACNITSF